MYGTELNDAQKAAKWNEKAKPCSHYPRRSDYANEFLAKSGIEPGDTVFDMGCGSGTLCLPLADDGHKVFCGDFSEKMLQSVIDTVNEEGITLITTQKMSFSEDWDKYNVPVCDLVFASRSLFDEDPSIVLPKLSAHARKRVCITIHISFDDDEVSGFKVIAKDSIDYFHACLRAITDLGYLPKVDYMSTISDSRRAWAFISWDIT